MKKPAGLRVSGAGPCRARPHGGAPAARHAGLGRAAAAGHAGRRRRVGAIGESKAKILVRIDRLAHGISGDVGPVGEGISEMRIDFGPGYRVYFRQIRDVATLLYGGDKSSQVADIRKAKALSEQYKD